MFVIFEWVIDAAGRVMERAWEQGVGEVRWEENPNPSASEIRAARWLLQRDRRTDWATQMEDVIGQTTLGSGGSDEEA